MTSALELTENVTLNLNGKKISGDVIKITSAANVTIENGTIESEGMGVRVEASNATLNIGKGVTMKTGSCCVFVPNTSEDVIVNIAGNLESTSTQYPTVCTNGNLKKSTINITGGSIKSESTVAVYFPSDGNLTITGGEITGSSAVEYRGTGLLKITGGTFTATNETFDQEANNSGSTTVGAAVAVVPYGDRTSDVEITGGTFAASNENCYAIWIGTKTKDGTELTKGSIGDVTIGNVKTTGLVYTGNAVE